MCTIALICIISRNDPFSLVAEIQTKTKAVNPINDVVFFYE